MKTEKLMKKKENTLTRVEFQVMSILWDIDHAVCAWDILERWKEPKPAYTTIATYLKMLFDKGYLDYFKNKGGVKLTCLCPKSPVRNMRA